MGCGLGLFGLLRLVVVGAVVEFGAFGALVVVEGVGFVVAAFAGVEEVVAAVGRRSAAVVEEVAAAVGHRPAAVVVAVQCAAAAAVDLVVVVVAGVAVRLVSVEPVVGRSRPAGSCSKRWLAV